MTFVNRQTHTALISRALPVKFVFVMVLALAFAGSAFGQTTLQVNPQTLPDGVVGTAYPTRALTATGGTPPYGAAGADCTNPAQAHWCVISGLFPPSMQLSTDGIVSGTPSAAGKFDFVVRVTDSSTPTRQTADRLFTITVEDPLVITTASPLPSGTVNSAYSPQFLSTTGGTAPISWSVSAGTLPQGMSLNANGSISGTPTQSGQFPFTVRAADTAQSVTKNFSITINPALSIQTQGLPPATIGAPYTTTLQASGGIPPYSWTALTPLPAGLTLNSSSGVLSGTPSSPGNNIPFTVQVADSSNAQPVSRQFTLTVSSALTIVTSNTLPGGEAGKPYTGVTLQASGGVQGYTWTLQSGGTFPAGMTLQPDGTLSGIPAAPGTYDFTVQVADNSNPPQTATKLLTLKIQAPLDITTQSPLPVGVVGRFYSKQIDTTSGQTNLTWSTTGGLPPGITLSTTGGLLSGTPTQPGTFDFTIKVDGTNPVQTTQKLFRIVVNPALTITTPLTLPDGFLGQDYNQRLTVLDQSGLAPYTWTNPGGNLPPGLTLSSDGLLSGRPAGVNTYTFTIQVDDSFLPTPNTARATFTLRVNNTLRITTDTLPDAFRNLPYSQQLLATGGTAPLTWVVYSGTLPTGLTLNTATGLLSGTPTTAESQVVTITVTDSRGLSASKDFKITVDPPLPALSAPGLPSSILPAHAAPVTMSLATPASSNPLSGKLVLTFTSKADVAGDDPMTRFSNGTRSVAFTIPANGTDAVFDPPVSLTAGSVAGTIRLAANFDNGGPQDVTVATTEIASTAPTITNVVATRTGNALEVQITGYSPSRRITSAEFTFELSVGGKAFRVTVPASVGPAFNTWFTSPTSIQFGSAFSYLQSFDYTGGNVNDVQSVTVRLSNAQGSTASQVITFK